PWKANVVRLPLNETCWLGINGVAPAYSGANYRRAIADYVALLNRAGLVVILDLHWTADTGKALGQAPMPNRDHTPEFWRQVAAAYKGNDRVIFDLFNEPFPDSNSDTPEAWRCWRDGGTCSGMTFQAAGMQELMDWMDARQGSYLAWVWDVWHDWSDLIASYDGTPSAYGATFRTRFGS